MKRSNARKSLLMVALATLALVGCAASGPTIRTDVDPKAEFSGYRSFGFFPAATPAGYSGFVARYLEEAISRELTARGYTRADAADLMVNFHLQARDAVEVTQTPATYYGWRSAYRWGAMPYETNVRQYTEGTLNIDLVDRTQSQLVWAGVAVGRVKQRSLDNPQPAIDAVVAQIFERYPARAGQSASL
jgi:hypothetical protein